MRIYEFDIGWAETVRERRYLGDRDRFHTWARSLAPVKPKGALQ
jgi:hypothetical protein